MIWLRDIWARSGKQIRRLAGFLAAALVIGFGVQWLATSNARMIVSQPVTINDIALLPDGEVLAVAYADGTVELRETGHQRDLIRRISDPGAAVMQLHLDDVTEAGLRLIMARADGRVVIETARDGTPLSDHLTIERSLLTPHFVAAQDGTLWVQGINERGAWLSRLEPNGNYAQSISLAETKPLQIKLFSATSDRAHVLTADQHLIWGTWDPETDYGLEFPITIKHRLPLGAGYITLQDGHVMTAENGAWRSATGTFIEDETGIARLYGGGMQGAQTANGEDFNPNAMTAAHRTLPLGSRIRVTNLENGENATLRINDRGPFEQNRLLDLTPLAATQLGFADNGVGNVRIEFLGVEVEPGGDELARVQMETSTREWAVSSQDGLTSAAYSPDGAMIAIARSDGGVFVLDAESSAAVTSFRAHDGATVFVEFSSDGQYFLTVGSDSILKLYEVETWNVIRQFPSDQARIFSARFSNHGSLIAVATAESDVTLFSTEDLSEVVTLSGHDDLVQAVGFSPDDARIVTAGEDGTARVWDVSSGEELFAFTGHVGAVEMAQFSPDGMRILTKGADGTIREWDSRGPRQLTQYRPDSSTRQLRQFNITSVAYASDGSKILIGGDDGTARLIDTYSAAWIATESGPRLSNPDETLVVAELPGHRGPVKAAMFSSDGTNIFTASDDGTGILWTEVRPNEWVRKRSDLPCQSEDGQAFLHQNPNLQLPSLWLWSKGDGICEVGFSETPRSLAYPLPEDTTVVAFVADATADRLRSILIGRANGTVEHRSRHASQRYAVYHGHGGAITHIETETVDGKIRVAIAAADGSVQIIDLPGGSTSLFARANTGVSSFLSGLNDMRVSAIDTIIPGIEETESDTVINSDSDASIGAEFFYHAPGDLIPDSGTGYTDYTVFAPDIVFPIKDAPASVQSIVFRPGGGIVGGDQCDPSNYHPAWRDNYCERRSSSRSGSLCESDRALHRVTIRVGSAEDCQTLRGQDPAERGLHEVVAVTDGIIAYIGSYTVRLRDQFGSEFIYYHLNMNRLQVDLNDVVEAGQVIGYVSNDFGGTPTNFHLGFEIIQPVDDRGRARVPPYMSLVRAYERREGVTGQLVSDDEAIIADPAPTGAVPKAQEASSESQDPIFYIHFDSFNQLREARSLVSIVESMGYLAPLERDPEALPSTSQLRYFRRENENLAVEVARQIGVRTDGDIALRTVYFEDYEDSTEIGDKHFEIWLAAPTQEPAQTEETEYPLETQE